MIIQILKLDKVLKIPNLLFSVSIISIIILFSANSSSISSIYAQDTQYSNNKYTI